MAQNTLMSQALLWKPQRAMMEIQTVKAHASLQKAQCFTESQCPVPADSLVVGEKAEEGNTWRAVSSFYSSRPLNCGLVQRPASQTSHNNDLSPTSKRVWKCRPRLPPHDLPCFISTFTSSRMQALVSHGILWICPDVDTKLITTQRCCFVLNTRT